MSALIESLDNHPAQSRDEKAFFGQGWSHYERPFREERGGHFFYADLYNTPNHKQVNWNIKDSAFSRKEIDRMPGAGCGTAWTILRLTPEESLVFAAEHGLVIDTWLAAALESCRADTTAESMARMGNVVDLPNFHAARAPA